MCVVGFNVIVNNLSVISQFTVFGCGKEFNTQLKSAASLWYQVTVFDKNQNSGKLMKMQYNVFSRGGGGGGKKWVGR